MPLPLWALGMAGAAAYSGVKMLAERIRENASSPTETASAAPDVQRQQLSVPRQVPTEPAEPEDVDQRIRQNLTMTAGSLGLILGSSVVPVLIAPGVGLLSVFMARTVLQAAKQAVAEKKLGVGVLDSAAFTLPLYMGLWSLSATTCGFISGARWLARRTEQRSREDLAELFRQQLRTAWVEHEGVLMEVPVDELRAGERVLVEAGMMIPVDGKVVEGVGRVDQQALTGEARPIDKSVGDEVLAATVLLDGHLIVELQQAGLKSAASELTQLLETVEQTRSLGQTRATQVIDNWAPTTLGFTALALATQGVSGSLAVVYSSIGYPLRYAGPAATLNFMRLASRNNIFIRDGRALEQLASVDLVVFDKTGTLTDSIPVVHRITALGDFDAATVLQIAATAERHQTHPLAEGIRRAAEASGIDPGQLQALRINPGHGLHVTIDGRDVLLGSARLLHSEGIDTSGHSASIAAEDIVVYVAIDGRLAGFIEFRPRVRDEADDVIRTLQSSGLEVVVLSGDREAATRELSESLNLDQYFAEVLPQQKAAVIERFRTEGRVVCFIGDGINDAIALRVADVSISMKGASMIAETAASIVLLDGTLQQLPELFRLAKQSDRVLRRSRVMTTTAGVGTMASVFLFGLGAASAMAVFSVTIGGCMVNSFTPLLVDKRRRQKDAKRSVENADVDASNIKPQFVELAKRKPVALSTHDP